MFAIAIIALFAAAAPAEEIVEDLESQEVVVSEEFEDSLYDEEEGCLEEIALEDLENAAYEDGIIDDVIAYDEE